MREQTQSRAWLNRRSGPGKSLSAVGRVLASVVALAGLTLSPSLARAQDDLPPAPEPGTDSSTSTASAKGGDILRDPAGVRGISPYWESISQGDRAYVAQDLDAAISAYRQAIIHDPKNPLGHYRLGAAFAKKEDATAAEEAWQAGLRFAGSDAAIKAKLLFCLADLRERAKNYAEADKTWTHYQAAAAPKAAKGYPATAVERKKRIADRERLKREYGAVRARIEQRLKEAEKASRQR